MHIFWDIWSFGPVLEALGGKMDHGLPNALESS